MINNYFSIAHFIKNPKNDGLCQRRSPKMFSRQFFDYHQICADSKTILWKITVTAIFVWNNSNYNKTKIDIKNSHFTKLHIPKTSATDFASTFVM